MGFNCGIVGLPNIGKSTLFNALTQTEAAEAANYPFCTIEPNLGRVAVPDERLDRLAELAKSAKKIYTQLEFVDIAGLVKGASKGEGLGNQFLANIREVDVICHVLRAFDDENITHVDGDIDPVRDAETVNTELILADMESLERRKNNLIKKSRGNDKQAMEELKLVEQCLAVLYDGRPARDLIDKGIIGKDDKKAFKTLNLLSSKPILYISNVEEECAKTGNALSDKVAEMAKNENAQHVIISAAIEAEIAQLQDAQEKQDFLQSLGLEQAGLDAVILAGYNLLQHITFFTCGEKEARAWTVSDGALAPEAAGVIHSDFERGFITAETISYDDYIAAGSEQAARDLGKMRLEGKNYLVKDGDVFHFRFNV